MPITSETTRICRMLKFTAVVTVSGSTTLELVSRPRKFTGIRPLRNPSHEPSLPEYVPGCSWPVPTPGCAMTPSSMPITTAINAVMANHNRVFHARRAALETSRRLAMEEITAVTTSGTTAALRMVT